MSTSTVKFDFVPRRLAKTGRGKVHASKVHGQAASSSRRPHESQVEEREASSSKSTLRKGENYLDDSAYRALFELALSEHSLWSSAELWEACNANENGYVPVSYLLWNSQYFGGLKTIPPEAILIRCVRSSSLLEARLIVSDASVLSNDWLRRSRRNDVEDYGGFEVRRRDWAAVKGRIRKYTSSVWDSRTVYVENLPHRARTYHSVYEFIRQLLVPEFQEDHSSIQCISFPAHHKDDPGAPPPAVGKGFAFVVLSHTKHVDYLLGCWPWNLDERPSGDDKEELSKSAQEAEEYGLRCMPKCRWDSLKEEYLALQQRLLEKTASSNQSGPSFLKPSRSAAASSDVPRQQNAEHTAVNGRDESVQAAESPVWFPANCLIFVKNVHPETSKTILRVLFASAFNRDTTPIDYVDYNKGLDSCYLRLSEPHFAQTLVSHFSTNKTMQANALDDVGTSPTKGAPIEVELVQGKKEEVYWEKVPEKIRRAAMSARGKSKDQQPTQGQFGAGGGKRKRRKRESGAVGPH